MKKVAANLLNHPISKSKLTWSASPCRIIHTVCGSPSRHIFDWEMEKEILE
ncbi:hypothetical protein [Nitrosomonas communis]|uniref:hypothetical protein n=1 Tax=Nitrosomonas communis TaxID=44574 RepID=UPI0015A713E8|nr:hypothetical protein [Nitrosomonas communis]